MLYSILIFGSEERVAAWTPDEEREVMGRHAELRRDLIAAGRMGPVLRLARDAARTVRRYKERTYVTDGPFAETKEQLMGIYIVEGASFDDALAAAERLAFDTCAFEISPLTEFDPGIVSSVLPE